VSRKDVERWVARYEEAWRAGDAEAAATLFTEDCVFRSHPFREAEDAREYTLRVFAGEEDVEPRFGDPVVEDGRAAVEYWAAMREDGLDLTLAGCLVFRLAPDGRCSEMRDVWTTAPERLRPPPDWGT
jgi:ketosteroid isomerase-like protein